MKSVLKAIRLNPLFNRIVRNLIRVVNHLITHLKGWQQKWPVSGKVKIHYNNKEFYLITRCDDGLANQLFYRSSWSEDNEVQIFSNLSRKMEVIYDVGANIGIYSLLAALSNASAKIYSFEPNPYNYNRLIENIRANGISNIQALRLAIGNSNEPINLTMPISTVVSDVSSVIYEHTKSFYGIDYKEIETDQENLDNLLKRGKIRPPDLIKIDVEFSELKVLRGAEFILREYGPILFAEIFIDQVKIKLNPELKGILSDTFTQDIEDFLKDCGYHFYSVTNVGILKVTSLFSNPESRNYIMLKCLLKDRFYDFQTFHQEMDKQFD